MTVAQAYELEKVLDAEHESLLKMEQQCCSYIACDAEDRESVRPEYDYETVQIKLADNERKTRKVHHAVHKIYVNTISEKYKITYDELNSYFDLIYDRVVNNSCIPDLLPKERIYISREMVEYVYANSYVDKAKEDYKELQNEYEEVLSELQKFVQLTEMEIDI